MIYGDPIILGGGGSGGPTAQDAILLATVPAGSTVSATKSGVTVTPTLWVSAADSSLETALFVFTPAQFDSTNPWTITATDGTNTASETVLITTNKVYEGVIEFNLYLFKAGQGEIVPLSKLTQPHASLTSTAQNITATYTGGSNMFCYCFTTSPVDLSPYSTLHLNGTVTGVATQYILYAANAAPVLGDYGTESKYVVKTNIAIGQNQDIIVDVSNLSINAYLGFLGGINGVFTALWLER